MANARRANIPLYRQTDPKYFPDYEFKEYPKIMTDESGQAIVDNPIYLMTTPRDPEAVPKEVMRNGKPVVIGGDPVVVKNPDEEAAFLKEHPECAKIVSIPINDTQRMAADNEAMKALLAENEKLRAQLGTQSAQPEKKKPGRPKKQPQPDTSLPADLT